MRMSVNKDAMSLAASINKKIGHDALVVASDIRIPSQFTTGSLSLDIALGGGWPANQWNEIVGMESHGKTAVVLKTVAANQAADPQFTTLWIAAEHYDADQAAALGVDNDRVLVASTQDMVIAYETMLEYAASRTVDCIVLDSYPALIAPEEEAKGMDEVQVSLGARTTNKMVRKAGPATSRSLTDEDRPILGLFINQFRDKIGCINYGAKVNTTEGWSYMGPLVADQNCDVEVFTYDEQSGKVRSAPVAQFHNHGPMAPDESWLKVTFRSYRVGPHRSVVCTENHRIMTDSGWKRADELTVNDRVMSLNEAVLTPTQREMYVGALLGDGAKLRPNLRSPGLRITQGWKQHEYAVWKHDMFGAAAAGPLRPVFQRTSVSPVEPVTGAAAYSFCLRTAPEMIPLLDQWFADGIADNFEVLGDLGPFALAIWYMDDGSLGRKKTPGERQTAKFATHGLERRLVDHLTSRLTARYGDAVHYADNSVAIRARSGSSFRFFEEIAPYIPECMQYKLPQQFRGKYDPSLYKMTPQPDSERVAVLTDLVSVEPWDRGSLHEMYDNKYDLGIEGTHNFFVNDLLVHNSFSPMGTPKTTGGGNGKNYWFYTRVEVKRDEYIEEKLPGKDLKVKVGQVIKVKTIKNKQAPPQQIASLDFYFRDTETLGFRRGEYDSVKETVIMGLLYDLIGRRGAYFTYGEERWQGREAMLQAFREHPIRLTKLDTEVRQVALRGKRGSLLDPDDVERAIGEGTRSVRRPKEPAS